MSEPTERELCNAKLIEIVKFLRLEGVDSDICNTIESQTWYAAARDFVYAQKFTERALVEAQNERAALAAENARLKDVATYLASAAENLMTNWGSDKFTLMDFAQISAVIERHKKDNPAA